MKKTDEKQEMTCESSGQTSPDTHLIMCNYWQYYTAAQLESTWA